MDNPSSIAPRAEWSVHVSVDEVQAEIEALAEALYREIGAAPDEVLLPSEIARRLGLRVERTKRSRARGAYRDGTIYVSPFLLPAIEEWTIGHEIGHARGIAGERECDLFGASLQMPRRPWRQALRELGEAWHELGPRFTALSTSAVLRYGETEGVPVAVVGPRALYTRNMLLPREQVRKLAIEGGPGIRRAPIVDAPDRIVLIADVDELG